MRFDAQYRGMRWTSIALEPRTTMDSAARDIAAKRFKGGSIQDYRIVVTFEEEGERVR